MKLFIVTATKNASELKAKILEQNFEHFELRPDTWFVAFDGTTTQISRTLGIRDGIVGSGVVCRIAAYSGYTTKSAWEWLGLHDADSE